jgi:subtilisin family serine protease
MTLSGIKANKYLLILSFFSVFAVLFLVYFLFFRNPADIVPDNVDLTVRPAVFVKDQIIVKLTDVLKDPADTEHPRNKTLTLEEALKSNYSKFFSAFKDLGLVEVSVAIPDATANKRTYKYYILKFDKEINLDEAVNKCNDFKDTVVICTKDPVPQNYQAAVNDPDLARQWHLGPTGMNIIKAWEITKGDKAIKVAAIDEGFAPNHPDLKANIVEAGDNRAGGHGTGVLGSIGQVSNNGVGGAGPAQVSMYGLFNNYSSSGVANRINEAVTKGAKVITMSFGLHQSFKTGLLADAAADAKDAGVLLLAAAGNCVNPNGGNPCNMNESPQDLDGVYTVAAMASQNILAGFSSYGPKMMTGFAAPGVNVWTTFGSATGYGNFGGTSAASPIAAGVAALVFSVNSALKGNQVVAILQQTAVCPNNQTCPNQNWGYGRLDAYAAVKCAQDMKNGTATECASNVPPPTPDPTNSPPPSDPPGPGNPPPGPTPGPGQPPVPVPVTPGGDVPVPSDGKPLPVPDPVKPGPIVPKEPITRQPTDCNPTIGNFFCFF